MRMPPVLQKGDIIALAAPARYLDEQDVEHALALVRNEGFNIRTDRDIYLKNNTFAGTDQERCAHLQKLLDDDVVKAILFVRGGYGSVRIIDLLDFTRFSQRPKWLIGYSDITVFHAHLQRQFAMQSLHASMPINFPTNTPAALSSLFACLQGHPESYAVTAHPANRRGTASGILTGGNLSVLYSLLGSCSFPDTKDAILFLEDIDEYLYHIDRMIIALKRAGVFEHIAGLVIGGMTGMKDNTIRFGHSAEEIITEQLQDFSFPVCCGFPAGHISDNRALIMGRRYTLEVGDSGASLRPAEEIT
ncbi:MAG: LD-carboxypeptidase [Bacteroidetes bacterium]|nr:LD-carboxypeptidase [Bacteroidota bacterium]